MVRIAICDDMADQQMWICELLDNWKDKPAGMTTEVFSDGDSLIRAHKDRPFDIILLDIIMPMFNGIDTAAELRKNDMSVHIVFLTSTPDYAVESCSVRADKYLLKPADPESFYECISEIVTDLTASSWGITVSAKGAVRRIGIRNIEFIEARGRKAIISLTDGSRIEAAGSHCFFEKNQYAEAGFFKCHRSYIVNMYQIDTYTNKMIVMKSGAHIHMSRGCKAAFEDAFFNLMFS